MRRRFVVPAMAMALVLWGCCNAPPKHHEVPPPAMVVHTECPPPALEAGMVWNGMPLPTGYAASSCVCLEKFGPGMVNVGQEFEYGVKVTNITPMIVLEDVTLFDDAPSSFNFLSSDPPAQPGEGGRLTFQLGRLGPGESRLVRIRGAATATGELMNCTSIEFRQVVCIKTQVVQPALRLTMEMPPQLVHCDPISLRLVVSNTGTGAAINVRVSGELPQGWTAEGGGAGFQFEVGNLAGGESRELFLHAHSSIPGKFSASGIATAEGGLKADASAGILLTKPVFQISKRGRETQYIHRPVAYEITLTNTGDGEARDTVLEDVLEGNARILDAPGGQIQGNHVLWPLGTLAPGESRKLSLQIVSDVEGPVRDNARATAYCAEPVEAAAETMFQGIPALLLEVVDLEDPVELGTVTTYQITVTNQGSRPDTNIRLVVELEEQAEYVSSEGASPGDHKGGKIVFAPVPMLPPNAQAVWRIVVKANAPGDTRFKALLESDELTRPVQETESTNMYR